MAMAFREGNRVRWFGIRPGHNGTQVEASTTAENTTVDLYQPASGKVACINTIVLSAFGTASGWVWITHTTSANVVIATIARMVYITGSAMAGICVTFPEPLELANQEKLRVHSNDANCSAFGYCKGRVE